MDMLNIITKSFDTRNILFKKKITDESDKEKLSKQKERMNKIYLAFDRRFCKHCSSKSKCKYCIKISTKYYYDENKLIKKDLENQLNRLEKLMRGL